MFTLYAVSLMFIPRHTYQYFIEIRCRSNLTFYDVYTVSRDNVHTMECLSKKLTDFNNF